MFTFELKIYITVKSSITYIETHVHEIN